MHFQKNIFNPLYSTCWLIRDSIPQAQFGQYVAGASLKLSYHMQLKLRGFFQTITFSQDHENRFLGQAAYSHSQLGKNVSLHNDIFCWPYLYNNYKVKYLLEVRRSVQNGIVKIFSSQKYSGTYSLPCYNPKPDTLSISNFFKIQKVLLLVHYDSTTSHVVLSQKCVLPSL